jgi:hypothetical protein
MLSVGLEPLRATEFALEQPLEIESSEIRASSLIDDLRKV